MDDEHDFEDRMLYQVEALHVHATRWQYPKMLNAMHMEEDFAFFLEHILGLKDLQAVNTRRMPN
jgi:hypothetical protein